MAKAISAIIQARYSSYLFPGRSMVQVANKTIIDHIVFRIRQINNIKDIILATTDDPEDDALVTEARRLGILIYRGSKQDVIARLLGAASMCNLETFLKVNGNYPLFDPYLAKDMISEHIRGGFHFSYNEHFTGTVYGTGCYVVQKELLRQLDRKKLTSEQREAGLLCLHQDDAKYKVNKFSYRNPRPHYNVCFDNEKDLRLIEFIFKVLDHPYTEEIIDLLDNNPVLVGSNKYESVQEVGLEKLYLFPEKLVALSRRALSDNDKSYPITIELSLTDRCNFDCVWCSDKKLRTRTNCDMDFKVLQKLFQDLREGGTKGIVIEGGGEPTLYKKFADTVSLAHDMGFGVGLITNGSMKIKDEIVNKLEWIRISLDASTSEEQKNLKNTDSFEKVMSNIKKLCSERPTVGIGYVVTSQNVGNLESLILRLRDFGVEYIQFRPVIDHKMLETQIDLSYLKRYQNIKFSVIVDGMYQNVTEGNDNLPCIAHSFTSVIASNGNVYLCGRLNIHDWLEPIGNINTQAFKDIWLGKIRRDQAVMVFSPEFCKKNCPRCRLTKFNQLFNRLDKTMTRNFI